MKIKNKIIMGIAVLFLALFFVSSVVSAEESAWFELNPTLETGMTGTVTNCSPLTVTNGTVAAYPTCTITCNSGYDLSGSTCTEHRSSGGGSTGGHVAPTADTTTVTPSTTTTTTTNFQFALSLRLGSRGNEVSQLQKILIAKGYLFGTADGSFGPKTHLAVIAFQKANNLFADGVVGRGTRAILNNPNMVWLQPVVTTTTTTNTTEANTVVTTTTTTYNFGTTTLTLWSRGEAVKELQRFLNKALSLNLTIDGVLGPKTINIIKQWQKANGLLDDGLVGAKTKALMNAIAKSFK